MAYRKSYRGGRGDRCRDLRETKSSSKTDTNVGSYRISKANRRATETEDTKNRNALMALACINSAIGVIAIIMRPLVIVVDREGIGRGQRYTRTLRVAVFSMFQSERYASFPSTISLARFALAQNLATLD